MSHVVDERGRYVRVGDRVTRLATGDVFFLIAVASPSTVWISSDAGLLADIAERPACLLGLEVVR